MPDHSATAQAPRRPSALTIEPHRVLRVLLAGIALLTLLGVAGELSRNFAADDRDLLPRTLRLVRRNFNPSGEQTVGSWFTAGLLLLAGGLVVLTAAAVRAAHDRFVPHWRALAAILVFLSCDEAVSLHEQLGDWVADVLPTGGILLWAWVVPYSLFAVAAALAFIPLLQNLPPDTRRALLLAGTLYVGGALGLEMVQAGITDARDQGGGPVTILAVIEETTEMLGAAVLVHTLLTHMATYVPVHLGIAPDPTRVNAVTSAASVPPNDPPHPKTGRVSNPPDSVSGPRDRVTSRT